MLAEYMSSEEKRRLLEKILRERIDSSPRPAKIVQSLWKMPDDALLLEKQFRILEQSSGGQLFFAQSEGLNTNVTRIGNRTYVNYCSYNYLGLSGNEEVSLAAKEAIDRYGTSVSASRIASGERPLHQELETELAVMLGVEECVTFVGGYGTNETVIGHLFGPDDLILYDSLSHASIQSGCKLSGAAARPFPHNNWEALNVLLAEQRERYRYALVVIEGVYSMDGDVPDLPQFIEVKKRHQAMLMVDEAHSSGVLGKTGGGIGEHFGVNPHDVDIWMGTLSKSFASCGGYVAGNKELMYYLRYTVPGFVFSVGMSPPNAASALAAIRLMHREPERVTQLRRNANRFRDMAKKAGLNTGNSEHSAVIPIILGRSEPCVTLYRKLFENGIYALPIIYPTVPENASRVRLFLSSLHTDEQLEKTVKLISSAVK